VKGYDPADPNGVKNNKPGVLHVPEPLIQEETATLLGVDGQKMSKSYNNTIELFAPDNVIKKTIMGIKTDSAAVEDPKPTEGSALHALLKVMATPEDFAEIDASFRKGGEGYGVYKKRLLDLFHATFDGARARRAELERDPASVEGILQKGADKARAVAQEQMDAVKRVAGLL
jgi:tryptophanyl-tRNA synthetase